MANALSHPTNVDLERNQLIRAALELVTTADATPVAGQIQFTDGASATLPTWSVIVRDGAGAGAWRVLGAINKLAIVTGFWSFAPTTKADGTTPSGAGDPPFAVGTGLTGLVTNLNAQRLGGYQAISPLPDGTAPPSSGVVPVHITNGRLVVGDPAQPYDAVNKHTLEAAQAGIVYTDPVKLCSTVRLNGVRSGNTITGAGTVVLSVDGIVTLAGDRLLLKDQGVGGSAADNGIYTVTNPGVAGSQAWVLGRAADADTSGELKTNLTVFVTAGDINANSQFTCSAAGVINTDPNTWTQISKVTAYVGRRGIKVTGQFIDFAKDSDYAVGSLFYASASQIVAELAAPSTKKFLSGPGGNVAPAWSDVAWTDVTGRPDPALGTGVVGRHARWQTTKSLESSRLLDDDAANAVVGVRVGDSLPNDLTSSTLGLGRLNSPFAWLWTNVLRLKPTVATGVGQLKNLLGFNSDTADTNIDHKEVRYFGVTDVRGWLGFTAGDVGAVPTSRLLTMTGTAGAITVSVPSAQDLTADREWTFTLDFALLDTRWVTRTTAQSVTGVKTFESGVGDSSKRMLIFREHDAVANPQLAITAGGWVQFGDGLTAPTGLLDFNTNRMRFSGRSVWFDTGASVKIDTALTPSGAPSSLLGLDASNFVRTVSAADLGALVGQPTLAAGAVGYGDAGNRLTGDAAKLRWDSTAGAERLGIRVASPTETLDMLGSFKLTNNVTTTAFPGAFLTITDTSNNSADWTNRSFYGLYLDHRKTGTAVYVTAAYQTGFRTLTAVSGGSISTFVGIEAICGVGAASGAPNANNVYVFKSSPSYGGATGSISTYYHFTASDPIAPFPQPGTHYGFVAPNLTSTTGAVRTAGMAFFLTTTGVGERYNLYAPGNANSYFAGNVGLGVTVPTARLDFAAGSTILAPMRFTGGVNIAAANVLLTTPLAGMVETDLTTGTLPNLASRLYYTDGQPVRHKLAFSDDLNFTNDANAEMAGAVVLGAADRVAVSLTASGFTEDLGTLPFTAWVRFLVPTSFRGPSSDSACGVGQSATSAATNGFIIWLDSSGALKVSVFGVSGSATSRVLTVNGFRTTYANTIVDVVLVREGNVPWKLYANGALQVTSEAIVGTPPAWNYDLDSQYFLVGNSVASQGSVSRIYRAALFNRALTASEVQSLSRYGIDDADQWGSMAELFRYSFASTTESFTAAGTAVTVAAAGGKLQNQFTTNLGGTLRAFSSVLGKMYRVSFLHRLVSGTAGLFQFRNSATTTGFVPNSTYTPGVTEALITAEFRAVEVGSMYWQASGAVNNALVEYDDIVGTRIGCLVDLDLGIGCGSIIPDRSGRYHGTVSGTTWSHYIAGTACSPVTTGGGTGTLDGTELVMGTRKWSKKFSIVAGGTANLDHNLGTTNVAVELWDDTAGNPQRVESYIESSSPNRVVLSVSNLRTSPRTVRAVIIG